MTPGPGIKFTPRGAKAAPQDRPCLFRGPAVSGLARQARGLDHRRAWVWCLHPALPLGECVCTCRGCGPKCDGYDPL